MKTNRIFKNQLIMTFFANILIATILMVVVGSQNIDLREVRCHVCKATVHEMENAVAQIDPKKKADVSGFRMDSSGNTVSKTVKLAKSEMFLTELMENICDKMEDYAKATSKKTGKFSLVKMMDAGKMNSDISKYDFVQDGDLNKSLKHYCLEALEEYEDAFLSAFMSETIDEDNDIRLCSGVAKYCKDAPIQESYNLESDDEYKDEL